MEKKIVASIIAIVLVLIATAGYFATAPPPGGGGGTNCLVDLMTSGTGSGFINGLGNGSEQYVTCGASYSITAQPNSGSVFVDWSLNPTVPIGCSSCASTSVSIPFESSATTFNIVADFTQTTTTTSSVSVSIAATPNSGTSPLTVSFTSSVSGGVSPYTYSWSLGDGASSTASNPSEIYSSPGSYLVQLSVTDSSGTHASASTTLAVMAPQTTTTSQRQVTTSQSQMSNTSMTQTAMCCTTSSIPTPPDWPPGLPIAWANSNMSVNAEQITSSITLSPGLEVSNIQSTTTISNLAFSSDKLQLKFATSGPVSITLNEPEAPSSVWADSTQISTWVYSNGVLSVSADPSTITLFFPASSTSILNIIQANIILVLILVAVGGAAAGAALRKR